MIDSLAERPTPLLIRLELFGYALSIQLGRLDVEAPAGGPAETVPTPMTTYAEPLADPLVSHPGGLEDWSAEDVAAALRRRHIVTNRLGFH